MDIKIDISPEAIERQIVDAVVRSGIGKRIDTAVLSALQGYAFQKTVEEAASSAIATMVREEITSNEELRAKVRQAIIDKLTDEHLNKLLEKVLQHERY